ncbi:MAG: serine protease, partial [Natronosporangium sp.]
MRRSGRVRVLSVAVAVVLPLALATAPGAAAEPPGEPPDQTTSAPAAGTTSSYQVTLVTGDRVRLDVAGDGTHRTSLVGRAAGSDFYQSFTDQGDAYVVPSAALPMLAADRLDLALFNVSGLVEQGFDDDRSPALPLLLTHDNPTAAPAPLGTGPALAGATGVRALPSVNGLALA